jgi:hypothetical protein
VSLRIGHGGGQSAAIAASLDEARDADAARV